MHYAMKVIPTGTCKLSVKSPISSEKRNDLQIKWQSWGSMGLYSQCFFYWIPTEVMRVSVWDLKILSGSTDL